MSETARRHITVEKIDIARQAGVEERRLIQRGLAASDQRAAAWGAVFLELVAQRGERSTRQGRDRAGEAIQNVALEQPADFRCQALRPSRNGKGGDAFDCGPCFLPCRHDIAPCDAPVTPSAVNPIRMIHLRAPVEFSATPAAWPCGPASLETTVTPRGSEHSPFGRHSSAPRLSGSPRSLCPLPDVRIGLGAATPNATQAHILGTDSHPGGEITCTAK